MSLPQGESRGQIERSNREGGPPASASNTPTDRERAASQGTKKESADNSQSRQLDPMGGVSAALWTECILRQVTINDHRHGVLNTWVLNDKTSTSCKEDGQGQKNNQTALTQAWFLLLTQMDAPYWKRCNTLRTNFFSFVNEATKEDTRNRGITMLKMCYMRSAQASSSKCPRSSYQIHDTRKKASADCHWQGGARHSTTVQRIAVGGEAATRRDKSHDSSPL